MFDLLPFWITSKHFWEIKISFAKTNTKQSKIYIYQENSGKDLKKKKKKKKKKTI